MQRKTPTVWVRWGGGQEEAWLEQAVAGGPRIRVDSAEWAAWLDGASTSFAYPVYDARHGYIDGFVTVRKECRQRGGRYWTAYRRCGGRVRKVYVGRAPQVTNARLAAIAQAFLTASAARAGAPPPRSPS